MNEENSNSLKRKILGGQTVLGIWSIVNSPVVTEILGGAGFDFQLLDLEHGLFDMGSLDNSVRACEATGCTPIVRVSGLHPEEIQNVLDLGVHGIIVPQIHNAARAREAVEAMHYAPHGRRGYNPFTRAAAYLNPPNNRAGKLHHDFVLSSIIIENQSGYRDLDEILAISNLDMVYLGVYDMAVSLGCEGDTSAPAILRFVDDATRRVRAAGKAVAIMVKSESDIDDALAIGANVLVWTVDSFLIHQAAKGAVSALHSAVERFARHREHA